MEMCRLQHERNKSTVPQLHRPGLANLFEGCVPKFSINFEEILSCAHGNFEEKNKVLEPSIIIINYCIIIIILLLLLLHIIIVL